MSNYTSLRDVESEKNSAKSNTNNNDNNNINNTELTEMNKEDSNKNLNDDNRHVVILPQIEEFIDVDSLPYVEILETHATSVINELKSVHESEFSPWPEIDLYKDGWGVLGLIAFGQRLEDKCALCPKTMNVLKEITEKTGLRIITAGFSCLAPGTVIVPHTGYKGYSSQIYRVHLGLIVPEGDVVLKVGNSQSKWQTGKVLAFNDACLHEAWNHSDQSRIVLLLDVEREKGALENLSPAYTKELTTLLNRVTGEDLEEQQARIRKALTSDEKE